MSTAVRVVSGLGLPSRGSVRFDGGDPVVKSVAAGARPE